MSAIDDCKLCEKGQMVKWDKPVGNPRSSVRVFFDRPEPCSTGDIEGVFPVPKAVSFLRSAILSECGVDVFKFYVTPVIYCCAPKVRMQFYRNCSGFRGPLPQKVILLGIETVAWMLFDGFRPPDYKVWGGREVARDETTFLNIPGHELFEKFDDPADSRHMFNQLIARAAPTLLKWNKLDERNRVQWEREKRTPKS